MLILHSLPLTVIGLSSHPRLKRERRHSWLASIVLRAEFELTEGVVVEFSRVGALLLYEWLATQNVRSDHHYRVGQTQTQILFDLECVLERGLHEIFDPDYGALLERARKRVTSNFDDQ